MVYFHIMRTKVKTSMYDHCAQRCFNQHVKIKLQYLINPILYRKEEKIIIIEHILKYRTLRIWNAETYSHEHSRQTRVNQVWWGGEGTPTIQLRSVERKISRERE